MPWHSQEEPSERQRSIAQLHADFQSQPAAKQRETMERVRRLIAQHPVSWLAKHWQEIYRLKGE